MVRPAAAVWLATALGSCAEANEMGILTAGLGVSWLS